MGTGILVTICLGIAIICIGLLILLSSSDNESSKTQNSCGNRNEPQQIPNEIRTSTQVSVEATTPPEAIPFQESPPTQLIMSNASKVYEDLESRSVIGRAIVARRKVAIAIQATEIVQADTKLITSQAEQIKTVLREGNEIERLKGERDLLPKEQEKSSSLLDAEIAENRLRATKAEQQRKDIVQPPPSESVRKRIESQPQDFAERLEQDWRKQLSQGVGIQSVYAKLLAECTDRYKDNPELLRLHTDALDRLLEEKLNK